MSEKDEKNRNKCKLMSGANGANGTNGGESKEEFCSACVAGVAALSGITVAGGSSRINKRRKKTIFWFGVAVSVASIIFLIAVLCTNTCKKCLEETPRRD